MRFVSINLMMTGMHGVELVWMLYSCFLKIYWLLVLVSGRLRNTPFWRKINEDRSPKSFTTGEVKLLQRHIQPILSKTKVRSPNFLFLSNYTISCQKYCLEIVALWIPASCNMMYKQFSEEPGNENSHGYKARLFYINATFSERGNESLWVLNKVVLCFSEFSDVSSMFLSVWL